MTVLVMLASATRADVAPAADGTESLGGQLLEDLAPDAMPAQPVAPPAASAPNAERAVPNNDVPISTRFDDLRGDTPAATPAAAALAVVRKTMQRAEGLLGRPSDDSRIASANEASAAQKDVVTQLEKLIAELSKKCQGGQCNNPNPQQSQRSQSKPGKKSGSASGQGRTAARDSTDRLDRASAKPVDKGELEAMIKELWGHLPQRQREQMMQSFSDEFLPKYELEIEQYYERLSEEQGTPVAP
jgi:hypothetical protein